MRCAGCGADNPPGFRFCGACGAALSEPTAVREERKTVTILFCDLVGSTAKADGADPEDVQATLGPYHAMLRGELERYGGTVEKFIGDAVMAVFGAPVAHEDDAERAVRAGLRIHDAIASLNAAHPSLELEVRIGIATGEGLVRVGARAELGEGLVVGDVVNTAARLQTAAAPGTVVVGELTHRLTTENFEFEALDPFSVKGKSRPLRVWRATASRALTGIERTSSRAPFVGRIEELTVLRGAFARAVRERTTQLVTITGEPGAGKSRLVRELFSSAVDGEEHVHWRRGHCLPYGEGITFWALGEIVKAQAGILESDDEGEAWTKLTAAVQAVAPEADRGWLVTRLAPLVGLPGESAGRASSQEEAFTAWRRFLEAIGADDPLVLVVEDAHWADPALLAFLEHLLDWSEGVALLLVVTARPELYEQAPGWAGGKRNATTIGLGALGDAESGQLIAALLATAGLRLEDQGPLVERAGGNPLYAEQFVRLLSERGQLAGNKPVAAVGSTGELPLPEAVGALIASRLDTLAPERKALLADAAVLGRVFWSGGLSALGERDDDQIRVALRDLSRAQFIRRVNRSSVAGQDEYAFWHALVRDVAYGTLPRLLRATKHLAVASWLEQLAGDRVADHAELLAHHYVTALELRRSAGDQPAADALARPACLALRTAADRALDLNAFDTAARHCAAALELCGEDDALRPRLLFGLGRARFSAEGEGEEELRLAQDALIQAGDLEPAAEAGAMLANLWWLRGKRSQAFGYLRRAVALLEHAAPSSAKGFVLGRLASALIVAEEPEQAIVVGRQAISIAEQLGLDDLRARALSSVGHARSLTGDEGWAADLEHALEAAAQLDSPEVSTSIRLNLAAGWIDRGELTRGFGLQAEALQIAERFGLRPQVRWMQAEQVLENYWTGRWSVALAGADAFIEESREGSQQYLEPFCRLVRGHIRLARGDLAAALPDAASALEAAREAEDPQVLYPSQAFSARASLAAGRGEEAAELVDELLRALRETVTARGRVTPSQVCQWSVDLAVGAADLGRAPDFLDIAAGFAPGSPWLEAAMALAAGDDMAAAERYAQIGSVPDAVAAWRRAAGTLLAAGRKDEGRACLARALTFCRQVGADGLLLQGEVLLTEASN